MIYQNPIFFGMRKFVDFDLWGKFNNHWADLDLDDLEYKKNDFNDSSWNYIPKSIEQDTSNIKNGFFNYIFQANNSSLSSGVVWLRTKILIDDISEDYSLIINNGIDHVDQTFFNEKLVGNTFSIDGNRNYKIPKNLLNKGENVIAIRITNLGGDGGLKTL